MDKASTTLVRSTGLALAVAEPVEGSYRGNLATHTVRVQVRRIRAIPLSRFGRQVAECYRRHVAPAAEPLSLINLTV